ncbi:MAG: DNA-binding protein [Campylobacterota bacterium]|nr:DNA-binding protein [Campylobacterota bacterium]
MKKLISSSEAAEVLGLSLQGIHYRIKKGQLKSIKKDGKIFVYIDSAQLESKSTEKNKKNIPLESNISYEVALKAKDDQILMMKKTIKFMKKQYTSEIDRLDKNQNKILEVFQSEVDLLKSAFHEMKNVYQVEHEERTPNIEKSQQIGLPFMDLKDFFVFMRNHNKTDLQIKSIILDKIKNGDKRFIYNKATKEVIIFKSDFLDLV